MVAVMRSPATWDYKRVVAVAFVVGVFMDVLDVTIVNADVHRAAEELVLWMLASDD